MLRRQIRVINVFRAADAALLRIGGMMEKDNKIDKNKMENAINSIFANYDRIRWIVDEIFLKDELPITKGQNDSFKLGYLIASIKEITNNIDIEVDSFNADFGDEFLIDY